MVFLFRILCSIYWLKDEPEGVISSPGENGLLPVRPDPVLEAYGLDWHAVERLLVCRNCSVAVTAGWADHCRKGHKLKVVGAHLDHVKTAYLSGERSLYLRDQPGFLPRLDFRPLVSGYKCGGCSYFAQRSRQIRDHAKDRTGCQGFECFPCHVQCASKWSKHPFFGVRAADAEAPAPDLRRPDVHRALALMEQHGQYLLPQAEGSRLSLIYGLTNWLNTEKDPFLELDKAAFVKAAEDGEEQDRFAQAKQWGLETMQRIHDADWGLIFGLGSEQKPFSRLQTDDSRNKYAAVIAGFALFAQRVHDHEALWARVEPVDVKNAVRQLRHQWSAINMWKLIWLLFTADRHLMEPEPLVHMYLRFCAVKDVQRPLRPDDIQRLVVKVVYFFAKSLY